MKIQLLLFGIVADLIGENAIDFTLAEKCSVKAFKLILVDKYPQLKNYNSYVVAVNENYSQEDAIIKEKDVVAIIPPVSGG